MKIYLLSFVDTNFGDNLFIHTVATRYQEYDFYMVVNEEYRESYELLCKYEKNIHLVSGQAIETFLTDMDGMLVVGGDMFGNSTYKTLREQISTIRKKGGFVVFLGISLFTKYSLRSKICQGLMFSKANHIVVRESKTYSQIKKLMIRTPIISSTDMAFNTDVSVAGNMDPHTGTVGISVRKKIPRNSSDAYKQYCYGMANLAMKHLNESSQNTVRFLAFSKGVYDDEAVSREIMQLCPEEYRERMECISFDGDVENYILEIQKCEKLLCTRFHALVFAILLNKSFIPIIYEDKMTRLLDEVGYDGTRLYYETLEKADGEYDYYRFEGKNDEKLKKYFDKANLFFERTDELLKLYAIKK